MSLKEKFKKSIQSALRVYEGRYATNNEIPYEESLAISHIREILKSDEYLDDLRDKIYAYVNTLNSSFFSFLWFVSDIKKILLDILNSSDFLSIKCIREDFKCLKEMTLLGKNSNFENIPSENFISRTEFLNEIKKIEERLNKEIAFYKGENEELKLQLGESENLNKSLQKENNLLKNQLAEIKQQLQASVSITTNNTDVSYYKGIIKQRDVEITELKAEIKRLKETLYKLESNAGQTRLKLSS